MKVDPPAPPAGALCCEKVFDRGWAQSCQRPAKHVHAGKPYCGLHNPARWAAKRAETNARWERQNALRSAEYAVQAARNAVADAARLATRQQGSWDAVAEAVERWDALKARLVALTECDASTPLQDGDERS